MIAVKYPPLKAILRNELIWTWLDSKEYILKRPTSRGRYMTEGWLIASEGQDLSSGCLIVSENLQQAISRRRFSSFEWRLENEIVTSETKLASNKRLACCGVNVLRQHHDGKILACWRPKPGFGQIVEGVCRPNLSEEKQSVILGMVLAEMDEADSRAADSD